MKFAVIKSGSRQYKVREGDELIIEKTEGEKGKMVVFKNLLLVSDSGKIKVGKPNIKSYKVIGQVISQTKGKKIRVATYKAKSRYRKVKGHRQSFTKVKILKIGSSTSRSTSEKIKTPKKK